MDPFGGVDRHGDEFFGDVKHFCQDYSIYTYIRYCISYNYIYILKNDYILHISYDHYDFYTSYTVYIYICIYYSLATRGGKGKCTISWKVHVFSVKIQN